MPVLQSPLMSAGCYSSRKKVLQTPERMTVRKSTTGDTNSKMSRYTSPKPSVLAEQPTNRLKHIMTVLSAGFLAAIAAFFSRQWANVDAQSSSIGNDLGGALSADASITLLGSPNFNNLTARWSQYDAPKVNVVVSVATEQDIQHTGGSSRPCNNID